MGLMYKLMRHKAALAMDLTHNGSASRPQQQQRPCRTITLEGQIVEQPCEQLSAELGALEEGKFTAEHILQLCRFLAEKSKKKRNFYEQVQNAARESPADNATCQHATFEFEELMEGVETAETAQLLPQNRRGSDKLPTQVLADRLAGATSADNVNSYSNSSHELQYIAASSNSCAAQYGQGKQDILRKIRRQIFERKRQRQLAHVQQRLGVWRPW